MLKKYYKLRHMLLYAGELRKGQYWHHIAAGDKHRVHWAGQTFIAATLRYHLRLLQKPTGVSQLTSSGCVMAALSKSNASPILG